MGRELFCDRNISQWSEILIYNQANNQKVFLMIHQLEIQSDLPSLWLKERIGKYDRHKYFQMPGVLSSLEVSMSWGHAPSLRLEKRKAYLVKMENEKGGKK